MAEKEQAKWERKQKEVADPEVAAAALASRIKTRPENIAALQKMLAEGPDFP